MKRRDFLRIVGMGAASLLWSGCGIRTQSNIMKRKKMNLVLIMTDKIPKEPKLPGGNYSSALRGRTIDWDNAIYYEFENTRMIRTPDWKYTRRYPNGPDELYNLKKDPGERENIVNEAEHTSIQKQLHKQLNDFFDTYADPKYDLWKGGRSKSYLLTSQQKPLRKDIRLQAEATDP